MSVGLTRAGFEAKFAVELDGAATDTLRSNHKDMIVFRQDVINFLDETKPKRVDHIHASPPCQGFSQAKQSCVSTDRDKQNNDLMQQFSRAVSQFRPTTASLENVKGMLLSAAKKFYLQKVVAELLKMEYQVRVMLLNAEDYGVPQDRKRLFLFAAQKGFPLPQVPTPLQSDEGRLTVGMALGELETIDPVEDGVPVFLDGKNEPVYDHIIVEPYFRGKMEYLERDRTAITVCRSNGIRHYRSDRFITIRERARLQSFPDSYHFCGLPAQRCDQIGNAVPVKLAEAVGRSIMEAYR